MTCYRSPRVGGIGAHLEKQAKGILEARTDRRGQTERDSERSDSGDDDEPGARGPGSPQSVGVRPEKSPAAVAAILWISDFSGYGHVMSDVAGRSAPKRPESESDASPNPV